MKEWCQNMDYWKAFEDWMFNYHRLEIAPGEINSALYLMDLQVKENLDILDICCGIGRHSIAFSLLGHSVTGIDISPDYIDRAKMASQNAGAEIEFITADAYNFKREKSFDLAISMFTSFGLYEDDAKNRQILKNAYESLRPGGQFFLDVMGKEIIARIFIERDWENHDGIIRIHEREIIDDFTKIRNRQIVIDGDDRQEFVYTHWLYSAGELRMMLHEAGFKEIEFYGDYDGIAYDNQAQRLIAIAK
ncbi:MAG: class I SAM-dependent methyltransferase [Candidatus Zixiibacteriota bacterium]